MARRSEADPRTSVAPAQKPWGASASFGRGAVKPPAQGTRGAATARAKENDPYAHVRSRVAATKNANTAASILPPAATAVAQTPKKNRSRPLAPAPAPAPALAAVPPAPSGALLGGPVAADSGADDVHPALVPFQAGDWSVSPDTAPASTATALVVGCTLHDLAPQDKRKVAKLIKQVVEYAESKKRLEAELDETHSRLDACARSRDAARKAEETRKAELRALTVKLDKALATVEAHRRREKRSEVDHEVETREARERLAARPNPPAAPELWRVSPMTRAVVDEVRAALRRGREGERSQASAGEGGTSGARVTLAPTDDRSGGGGSPAERQRPPLAVAPTAARRRVGPNAKKETRERGSDRERRVSPPPCTFPRLERRRHRRTRRTRTARTVEASLAGARRRRRGCERRRRRRRRRRLVGAARRSRQLPSSRRRFARPRTLRR